MELLDQVVGWLVSAGKVVGGGLVLAVLLLLVLILAEPPYRRSGRDP